MNIESPTTPVSEPQQNEYISRKERRERRAPQRLGMSGWQGSDRRRKILRRIMIWGLGLLTLLVIGWGIIKLSSNIQLPSEEGGLAVPVSEVDNSKGPATAPIVVVEYSDFQCPACGAFYPLIKQLMSEAEAKDRVKFVYRHFPLSQIHPNADLAARASEAAGLQNKFWEMHDILFENQAKWSGQSATGAKKTFIDYATEMKLDISIFSKDIDSDKVKDKIKNDYAGGVSASVNSTPTFFINGKRMPQVQSYEQFKQAILSSVVNSTSTVTPTK